MWLRWGEVLLAAPFLCPSIFVRFRPDIRMAVIFVYLASVVTEPLERYLVESGKCEKKIQLRFRFPKLIVSVSGTVR